MATITEETKVPLKLVFTAIGTVVTIVVWLITVQTTGTATAATVQEVSKRQTEHERDYNLALRTISEKLGKIEGILTKKNGGSNGP